MRRVRYPVARIDDLMADVGKTVPVPGRTGACTLFLHQGRVHAVGELCPHQNTPLDGAAARSGEVTCRRHGYRFELRTGDCLTLGGYGLPVYPVTLEDGVVSIDVWED